MNKDYKRSNENFKARREIIDAEIMEVARNLSPEEIQEAIWVKASTKWARLTTATIDFKPESKGEENK